MANSADPDQLASSEANWSGSTFFAKAGYIRAQHDKGLRNMKKWPFSSDFCEIQMVFETDMHKMKAAHHSSI